MSHRPKTPSISRRTEAASLRARARFARALPHTLQSIRAQLDALGFADSPITRELFDALDAAWVGAARLSMEMSRSADAEDHPQPAIKRG